MNIVARAVVAMCVVLFATAVFRDIGLSMIFNIDAFLIVAGGATIALFAAFPPERIKTTVSEIKRAYTRRPGKDDLIDEIIAISRMHMKTTVRSMENRMMTLDNDFLKLGVRLLVGDYRGQEIRNIMDREMMLAMITRSHSQNMLRTLARITPSLGLAGTVISLIRMFRNLESLDAVAPMMAVALMSTLYGVIIANLIMLPLCSKLKERAIESEALMNTVIEGILAIHRGEHPLKIEERLRGCQEHYGASSAPEEGRIAVHPAAFAAEFAVNNES
ncbi:MAG: MotA/TolQ/ExbB proton channel family protein [Nitrospiraceae bacterium]|nr:MAG: MotA/TolQ/ExbB proton channel family protein [Nitrospiraceae bacterium]